MPPRRPQFVRTRSRALWLTDECHQLARVWAERQGLSISAGIEALIRLGLGQAPLDALGPALSQQLLRDLRREFGRISHLYAAAAIDAGQTQRLVRHLLRRAGVAERDYDTMRVQARLEAIDALRRNDVLAQLGWLDEDEPAGHDDGDETGDDEGADGDEGTGKGLAGGGS